MITHIVMMKFKESVTAEDIDALEAMLDALPEKIIEIQSYDFGRDVLKSPRSDDFALVSVFANLDTLAAYQQHPAHLKVAKRLGEICSRIAVVDYENKPYPKAAYEDDIAEDPWQAKNLFKPA